MKSKHKLKVTTSDNRMGSAKVQTPVKAPKNKGPTRPPRQANTMPSADMAIGAAPKEYHDPESDLHTLTRAEQIKADAKRHGSALAMGKQKIGHLSKVVKGMKVSTSDV